MNDLHAMRTIVASHLHIPRINKIVKHERGTGKSSWGENSIFIELVKHGSNKVQTGTFWCKLRYSTLFFIFVKLLTVRPQKIKNQKNKEQKNDFVRNYRK